jgi:hypothetical protein
MYLAGVMLLSIRLVLSRAKSGSEGLRAKGARVLQYV